MARGQSTSRKVRALATRRRMLRAAYRLFCERGYAATTMNAIADEAGVAVQTIYFTFNGKAAILGEVLGAAITGFDAWTGPPPEPVDAGDPETIRRFHGWMAAFEAEPDPRRALAFFFDLGGDSMARAAPLTVAMQGALGDPDVRAIHDLAEQRRAESFRAVVKLLKKKGGLKKGLSIAKATDVMLVIFSGPTYQALLDRGWSHAECRRFFVDVLAQQLLPPS